MVLPPHPTSANFLGDYFVNNFCTCTSVPSFFPLCKQVSSISLLDTAIGALAQAQGALGKVPPLPALPLRALLPQAQRKLL